MSNLTEVNKLMVGWFMGSLEATLWPSPVNFAVEEKKEEAVW